MEKLSYTNEDDKCYGATGMAIGIVGLTARTNWPAWDLMPIRAI